MSDNLSFYRKYRPQSLNDLIGAVNVKNTLQKAFLENRLSHAYLFTGPRGTGKTSTARILAKMVNCDLSSGDKSQVAIPCNSCDQCISITNGSNLDLIEIDAASNRGIDDIRTLRENIRLSPSGSKKKVYIIDEVHMLTTEAFNALLKTLEEPPAHALFILATTELHKIPDTILSRVQKIDFKLATSAELGEAIKRVADAEKIEIEEGAIPLINKAAEGSFRDCMKLLDQLSSQTNKITVKLVEEQLQGGNFETISKMLSLIAQKETALALEGFLAQIEAGVNIKEYLNTSLDYLRLSLLLKNGVRAVVADELGEEKTKVLEEVANFLGLARLINLIGNFQKAYENLKFASIPSLPLEIAIVESCQEPVVSVENEVLSSEQVRQPQKSHSEPKTDMSQASLKTESQNKDAVLPIQEILNRVQDDTKSVVDTGRDDGLTTQEIKMVVINSQDLGESKSDGMEMGLITDKWNYVLETIKPLNFSLEALLRSVRVLDSINGRITIEVPYSFHQRILETPKSRDLLESVLTDVLGKSAKIKTVIGKRPARLDDLQNVEIAADDEIIRIASEIFSSDSI